MLITVTRLVLAGLLPIILSIGFYYAEKETGFGRCTTYYSRQIIIGICFGGLAILATEAGISVDGAVLNVRNAAPLAAGLIFGGPAGILAGLIGGIERWFSVYWGVGEFTRLACTLGTIMAGIVGAGVRKFMLENERVSWFYGLAVGCTTEVLHMLLIVITHPGELQKGFLVVQKCAIPMIAANGLSVMLSILAVSALGRKKESRNQEIRNISQTFQKWLLVCVLFAFLMTMAFTHVFQTRLGETTTDITLRTNIQDVRNDISEASDKNLLEITREIANGLPDNVSNRFLQIWADVYEISEINLIDEKGIIFASSNEEFVGFDMEEGGQSQEFMKLLREERETVQKYQPTTYDASLYMKYAGVSLENGCFLQVGYNAEDFHAKVDEQVINVSKNRHIGLSGFVIICSESGQIVSDHDGHRGKNLSDFSTEKIEELEEGKQFTADIYGTFSYCMYTVSEGYYIVGVLPENEALLARDVAVYILAFMETIVFAAIFAFIFFLIKKLVVENIQKVNQSLGQITNGNLDVVVNVRGNEEFASLSDDINSTVLTLKHYIAEAAARIDQELEFARQIQHSSLPSVFPPYPNRNDFSIFATMDTAKEVGGDFYDFYLLDENKLAFLIADVSGKGIPAAMFMMTAKTLIKGFAESGMEVHDVFTSANGKLCENNEAGMFVTAWMGILDLGSGVLSFVNAGHNFPVIRHKDTSFEFLKRRPNFVLAGMDGVRYQKQELQLQPGDTIYLYTDGVTEAQNMDHELFGDDRLLVSLNEKTDLNVEEICKKVKKDVDSFVGEADQFDDITMVCVKLNDG